MMHDKVLERPIILIGFMGSGKSSVGRKLARELDVPFTDLDARIEEEIGISIQDFFAVQGEAAFRTLEAQVLEAALNERGVIATGGGIVTQEKNRNLLQSTLASVIYLRAQPETLAQRIRRQPGVRPLIDGQSTLSLEQTTQRAHELLQIRAPFYESCAHCIIDTDECALDDVVDKILKSI
jgi:shikimate kinase